MSGETVLVTGASSGIGRELARCFAADGARLILVARSRTGLAALADELRQQFKTQSEVVSLDLSRPEAARQLFEHTETNGTRVDVLVNNAGVGACGRFVELPLERQMAMIELNVTTLARLSRFYLPGIVARRRGGLLNVASTAAFAPGAGMAVYYATKAFVLSFSEAVAEELAGSGVTVTALCPGPTETRFATNANFEFSDWFRRSAMSPAAVARIGHRAFRRGKVVAIAGARNQVLTFSARFAPRALVRKITARLNRVARAGS